MAVDFEKLQRINKLAKSLMDSGMAASRDEAVKMAETMVNQGEQSMQELIQKQKAEQETPLEHIEEEVKEAVLRVEEKLHVKEPKKEVESPVRVKELTAVPDEDKDDKEGGEGEEE